MEQSQAAIQASPYKLLLAVSDELNMELVEIIQKRGKVILDTTFVFEYTDKYGWRRYESTKFGTRLKLTETQLLQEIDRGIFKPIKERHVNSTWKEASGAKETEGVKKESKKPVTPAGRSQSLFE